MDCASYIWGCTHSMFDYWNYIRIRYFGYRIVKHVVINNINTELEIEINEFYICNIIHDITTLQEYVGFEVNYLSFYYKNKLIEINCRKQEIVIDHNITVPILLDDIALTNCDSIS